MNTLCAGLPFGTGLDLLRDYQSRHGCRVRTLAIEGPADFHFHPEEMAAEVIERVSREWPVDLLMCWVPELFPPPRAIEDCPVRTVAAISDWNLYYPQLAFNAARFDVVLCDKLGAAQLQLPYTTPSYLAPLYSHNPTHHYSQDQTRTTDIVFAGNLNPAAHPARGRVLERAAELADRWRIQYTSGLDSAAYREALTTARIAINYGLRHEMNLRCFEALACGALLFVENENLEIRDLLVEGHHFVAYDPERVCEQLEHYLTHEEERARIAAQGQAKIQELVGHMRLEAMLAHIQIAAVGARPFRYLSDPQKKLAECMMYASSHVESQRVLAQRLANEAAAEFPDDAAMVTAAAITDLQHAAEVPRENRPRHVHECLARLQRATELLPESAVPWLNLAYVCRRSNKPENETFFLERALHATSSALGGLLLGHMDDPYYVAWRRAMAVGQADTPHLLHTAAHARMAIALLERGDYRGSLAHAQESIALHADFAPPYRAAGRALLDLGLPEQAAAMLRHGLGHTCFDAEMRLTLVHALHDTGDREAVRAVAQESARIFSTSSKFAHLASMFREYC